MIKDYFMEKYSFERITIFGIYGRTLSQVTLNRLLKFAIKNNDKNLINLINQHLNYMSDFIKDPEKYRETKRIENVAKKYNL